MQPRSSGYYSSSDKDVIRDHFDLPLLRQFYQRKGKPLSYFGLPGDDALDIKAWREFIGEVGAVERAPDSLKRLEQVLHAQFPEIRFTTHLGEIDEVILGNRGKEQTVGGQSYRPRVSNNYEPLVRGYVWGYDVVYLDYFGTFLPRGGQGTRARRASALTRLLDSDRVDAWQPWILLITVEAQLNRRSDREALRDYLKEAGSDASIETLQALGFLLSGGPNPVQEATRVIHGATAILVADSARPKGVVATPRGTVLYEGANGRPMVHMAFEFRPSRKILSGTSDRLSLLSSPLLCTRRPSERPWLDLLPHQCPSATRDSVGRSLDFLETQVVSEILSNLT